MKFLTFKLWVLVISLTVCCPIFSGQQTNASFSVPEGWKKVNARGLFTFYLPRGAWDTGFRGIDEYYQDWRVGRMRFKVVYEPMGHLSYDSREKVFGKVFKESVVEIGGRKAYLCEYSGLEKGRKRYYADLYVGEWPQGHVKLWMQADAARPADLEIAKQIFHTLEFLKP
ncbi:MAG TPA: hypothetical protein VJU84_01630 [Pyrinomonadaceae bacterium]|nr:hypothetical protein [Pyrinomonadaceae bacterium]